MTEGPRQETRAEYLARINSMRADGTPNAIPAKTSKAPAAKKSDTVCPVTGGAHQFAARRSTARRAAKITVALVVAPVAGLIGGKNMGQCSACGKKVKWDR